MEVGVTCFFFGGEVFGATELERRELLNQLEIICCIYTPYLVWRTKIWYGKSKV